MKKPPKPPKLLQTIGWREWIALPDFGVQSIKAKIDTGARTSSLHAFDIERFRSRGEDRVRFTIHPEQRTKAKAQRVEALLLDKRSVRPSSGESEMRHVVEVTIELMGSRWPVELTLTRRDAMGFRMLLGRQALRGHVIIDPGRSFLNGRRVKGTRRLKKKKPKAKS